MTENSFSTPILKNKKDIRTLVFVSGIALVRIFFWWYSVSLYWLVLPISVTMVFILFCIKHNHIHVPIFNSVLLNSGFDYVIDILTGNTVHDAYIIHIANHHKETNKHRDWGNTERFTNNKGALSIVRYALTTPYEFLKGKLEWMKDPENKQLGRKNFRANLILWTIYILAAIIDFKATLLFIILPNLLAQFILVSFNYFQHNGCNPSTRYNHSRNFTGTVINYLTFNNGFHIAHHHYPSAHWSQFKEIHIRLHSKIDPDLNEPNFLKYFFRILFDRNKKSVDHQGV
jgi:fatty acid desaturase